MRPEEAGVIQVVMPERLQRDLAAWLLARGQRMTRITTEEDLPTYVVGPA